MVSEKEYAKRRKKIAKEWIKKHPKSKTAKDSKKKNKR